MQEGVMMEEGRGGRGSGKKEYCWGDGWDGCWLQPVDPAGSRPRRLFWSPWFSCLCASFFMAFARVAPFGLVQVCLAILHRGCIRGMPQSALAICAG